MKITVLCSSNLHPVNAYLQFWINKHQSSHRINIVRSKAELIGGDLLFLISCSEMLKKSDRSAYKKTLVIHASDLPNGRGWSPHIWQIIEGATKVTLTLLEAEDKVDSGPIWKQIQIGIKKDALWDEINNLIFSAEISLMDFAVENIHSIQAKPQSKKIEPTYYPKRTPEDSKISSNLSISEQFDLIRICDPQRFPAYFELHGYKYIIKVEKV